LQILPISRVLIPGSDNISRQPTVRLKIRVILPDGTRRYVDPVKTGNGKLKPLYALIDGQQHHHPEGIYCLRYAANNGKRIWDQVGPDPVAALLGQQRKEWALSGRAIGRTAADDPLAPKKTKIKETAAEYLAEVKMAKSNRTWLAYDLALRLFLADCRKTYLEDVDRKDLLHFIAHLKSLGKGPRTVANNVRDLKVFFLSRELKWPLKKTDRVRYTEPLVKAYTRQDIARLIAAADVDERDLFQFFLCTGAREKEVAHATWRDVDLEERTFSITEKRDSRLQFTTKDHEEGLVPLPDFMVELLANRKKRYPTGRLIFPGTDGKPEGHFLRTLKKLALRGGLNCGHCTNKQGKSCADHPVCDFWILHRFRKAFATRHSEAGVPVRTIQRWLRHSDLDTTLRYLASSDDQTVQTRDRINSAFVL